jgi:VCBS repeat-containing protein
VVGALSTTDPDAGDTHTYTLVAGDGDGGNASFTIEDGDVKTSAVLDFETQSTYSVRVRSTDQGGLFTEQVFTIAVTGENEAATALALSSSSVAENEPVGTVVGTLSTTDPDAGETHTYTLVAGDGDTGNASFTIEGSDLKTSAVLDFETQSSYSVRVRSTDQGGLLTEQVFTVTVSDVSEAPTATITPNGTSVNTDPITFTVTFDRAVTGVGLSDLTATGWLGELTLSNFTPVSAAVYTVEVSGMVEGEDVTLTLTAAGSGIQDTVGNALVANAAATVTLDTTPPSGSGTGVAGPGVITFTIQFMEDVTGLTVDDLIAEPVILGETLTLQNFTVLSASSFTVEVIGMTQSGTIMLHSPPAGAFSDLAGNPSSVDAVLAMFDWTA